MKLFYYVHTGHRIGLDRFRRATTIIRSLGDVDITLLCSDFRIAHEAKHFGVKTSVGLDVVRNIPHIAHHGDKIIFDSDEANPIMLEDMKQFFSTFIHLNENDIFVDEKYFEQTKKTIKLGFFFGDDDYHDLLLKLSNGCDKQDISLLMGHYFFLGNEDKLAPYFDNVIDEDE